MEHAVISAFTDLRERLETLVAKETQVFKDQLVQEATPAGQD